MIVCVATRGRPAKFAAMMQSLLATRTVCRLYIRVDADDPLLGEYLALPFELVIGLREGVAAAQQECLARHPDEDCYAFIGDDTKFHTYGWDELLRDMAGLWGVSYPDDGLKGERQATHPFIGGEFLRAIGFWALPGLHHLYTDTVWDFLGRRYGNLTYCPDVLVEHLHWSAGKSERDEIYAHPRANEDQRCFLSWTDRYQSSPIVFAQIAASVRGRSPRSTISALSH